MKKKIGILFGRNKTFCEKLITTINDKNIEGITAEAVLIDKVLQDEPPQYDIIIDRVSHTIPFYSAYLKHAIVSGTTVINNPFWIDVDNKFFHSSLASKIGVLVPKTALLPSCVIPNDTINESFANLIYPLDWDAIFNYVGFPAYMKPYDGRLLKNITRIESPEHFFAEHPQTGQQVMLLQEAIDFTQYYRCFSVGMEILVLPYNPLDNGMERYQNVSYQASPELKTQMEHNIKRINQYLGYDFNVIEFAVKDNQVYALDFLNPVPLAHEEPIGEENFNWLINKISDYAIAKAQQHRDYTNNVTWGTFVKKSVVGTALLC